MVWQIESVNVELAVDQLRKGRRPHVQVTKVNLRTIPSVGLIIVNIGVRFTINFYDRNAVQNINSKSEF